MIRLISIGVIALAGAIALLVKLGAGGCSHSLTICYVLGAMACLGACFLCLAGVLFDALCGAVVPRFLVQKPQNKTTK